MSKSKIFSSVLSTMLSIIRENVLRRLIGNVNYNDRIGALHRAWAYIFTNHIRGAYYEFGVYKGDSFRASYREYRDLSRWIQSQLSAPELWRREAAKKYVTYQ